MITIHQILYYYQQLKDFCSQVKKVMLHFIHLIRSFIAPGTPERPLLNDNEAQELSDVKYLQNWEPDKIVLPSQPDYIVNKNSNGYKTIQTAINAAVTSGKTNRQYIYITPNTYKETVYIPKTNVPITLYGDSQTLVKIILTQPANMSLENWINQINPNNQNYKEGDPAWSMYNSCVKHAQQNNNKIGTQCSSVVWAQNVNLQMTKLTIENLGVDAQAVALSVTGDKSTLYSLTILGYQDTLYLGGTKNRMLVDKTYITGYTDFVFGNASVIFKDSVFKIVLGHFNSGVIFAPNTAANQPYGFLVRDCLITADDGITNAHLGRAWDTNLVNGQYVPGISDNGQILIKNTRINGSAINVTAPWRTSTSNRTFKGNVENNRDLNNNNYNRMWEYNNTII